MRSVILWMGVACVVLWFGGGGEPVSAEDGKKDTVETLRAELRRTRTETTHLREAYNQLVENATRATRAVTALTMSLHAARGMIATLKSESQRELAKVTAERDERDERERALAHLNKRLAAEQEAHASDEVRRGRRRSSLEERANRAAIGLINAENKLARTTESHVAELRRCHTHYGRLVGSIGKPAVPALLALLADDPSTTAPHICPILGRIGPSASEAIPALEAIVGDKRYRGSAAARCAEEALKAIRVVK